MIPYRKTERILVERHISAHLCRVWRFIRQHDGLVMPLTDHDRPVEALQFSAIYKPSPAIAGRAIRYAAGLKEVSTEVSGAVIADDEVNDVTGEAVQGITIEDLRADLWKGAQCYHAIIDWRYPWLAPYRADYFEVADVGWNEFEWVFDLRSASRKLSMKRGEYHTKGCLNAFGDSICNRTGKTPTNAGTTTHRFASTVVDVTSRRKFRITSPAFSAPPENVFAFGFLQATGTLSPNFLLRRNVESSTAGIGSAPSVMVDITLTEPFPFDIEVGDQFDAIVGCDGSRTTCQEVFDNFENFKGNDFIPGADELMRTPGAS